MELGNCGISWFRYVPEFAGNRDLPEGERISLEILKLRTVDLLAMDDDPDSLYAWRDEALSAWLGNPEFGAQIKAFRPSVISVMRQFVNCTRKFRNFVFDGQPLDDPIAIFLRLPLPGNLTGESLVGEISSVITRAASLWGADLKNYVAQCGGSSLDNDAPAALET